MTISGPAERLTIYVGESDRHHRAAMHAEIVHRAHAAGMAGASVWRGFEGYGANNHIHTTRILSLSEDLPIKVEIIDTTEKIDAFIPYLDELGISGLVVREPLQVVWYGRGAEQGPGPGQPGPGQPGPGQPGPGQPGPDRPTTAGPA